MNTYNEVDGGVATYEKLKQDNAVLYEALRLAAVSYAVLYEALRLAAVSYADEFDPLGTAKMHLWIEQAQRNLLSPLKNFI